MGTGKATVAALCARLGALVVDADELAHDVMAPGTDVWRQVVEHFGRGVLGPDGAIDRRALARVVFGDADKLGLLTSLIHPPVIAEMERRLADAEKRGGYAVAVVDLPLLFETGLEERFDRVVVVTCPREEEIRRCQRRDKLSREEIEQRLRVQMPLGEKVARADYVIDNGGTRDATERQVREMWQQLTGGSV